MSLMQQKPILKLRKIQAYNNNKRGTIPRMSCYETTSRREFMKFLFSVMYLFSYIFIGAYLQNSGIIVAPAFFSLYGAASMAIYQHLKRINILA